MSAELPPTEATNPRSAGLDLLSAPALVELLVTEQHRAVDAVLGCAEQIAQVVEQIAQRLANGGALHYVGAGSSGRIAVLDAAEMPPTFGTSPELVRAHIAGGTAALVRAVEGAEDDAGAGAAAMGESVRAQDAVIGISASGSAPFVVAAVERARATGAFTVALTSSASSALARAAHTAIVLATGAELLAGSTRMKAGTAQKIALNAISTAVMVRLNNVYDNLMVGVVVSNEKLRARALRLIAAIAQVDEDRARDLLAGADGRVKVAIVMARRGVDAAGAQALLDGRGGSLRAVL
jgi:N-acetylmuramic acid 6-phosphate etherase